MGITIKATPVFKASKEAYDKKKYRGFLLAGGSRSSKTWSIIQLLLVYCQDNAYKNKNILIARQRYSDLKDTVMTDFFNMLVEYGMYKEENHTRSHPQSYTHLGNTFYFRGLDAKGAHGEKRNVVWINEAFETEQDAFRQLNQRLTDFFIMDYNPCFTEHWILDSIKTRPDVFFHHSTMLDNPFLPDAIRNEILAYDPSNPVNVENGTASDYHWQVYGLGIGAKLEGIIFPYVTWLTEFPKDLSYSYSMDFGYVNDPSVLVKIHIDQRKKEIYAEELFYEPIDNPAAINDFMVAKGIERHIPIIADSADKYVSAQKGGVEMVKDLKTYGWNISKVSKTMDLYFWIMKMKEYKLNIVSSINLKQEFENYRWRTINGVSVNQPVDKWNHGIDAIRYGLMGYGKSKKKRFWD